MIRDNKIQERRMKMKGFEIAKGTVIGREHRRLARNNQDASFVTEEDGIIIATVCDGCSIALGKDGEGYAPASEVGSNLIARLFNKLALENLAHFSIRRKVWCNDEALIFDYLESLRIICLEEIMGIASKLGKTPYDALNDFFLATIVSVIITPEIAFVCMLGDGVAYVNGDRIEVQQYPDNKPPYIIFGALNSATSKLGEQYVRFNLLKVLPISEIKSVFIASDGADYIIRNSEKNYPGKQEKIGDISQFWENPKFFTNPDLVRRKLALMNSDHSKIDWELRTVRHETGFLEDDTTLIAIRKEPEEESAVE